MTQSSATEDPLLLDLTPPQRQAVTHVQGPLLVLAGPGSGKTRVITRRIAYLILRSGIAPWNVLAITFTNKAAGEMRQRVAQLVSPKQARAVSIATFHAFCARVLRQFGERIGLPPNYSIYDSADQERAAKQAIEFLQLSTANFPPGKVLHAISSAKNELVDPAEYEKTAFDYFSKNVLKVYRKYQDILRQNHALDFDDLLLKTIELIKRDPETLAQLRDRYQYVLVDEYQDTNHAQFVLAHALAPGNPGSTGNPGLAPGAALGANLCVTGDPDQSIYGWRGASIRNILEFEQHYPQAQVVRLEQNYRSTGHILAAADTLIQNNLQRKHKRLWTENPLGAPVLAVTCQNEQHEAQWIVQRLRVLQQEENFTWGDMAVFYRMNSLSRVMEEALRNAGIPYQIARGTAFFDRKEIKDALAYLRLIANPADEVNLLRIINTPARGISDATVKSLHARAVAAGISVHQAMQRSEILSLLNPRAAAAVERFCKLLQSWHARVTPAPGAGRENLLPGQTGAPAAPSLEPTLRDFVQQILEESGLQAAYAKEISDPDQERLANLGELITAAAQFENDYQTENQDNPENLSLWLKLQAYLQHVSLVSDVDGVQSALGSVTLMTLHAAKGLEFPVVSILGLEDGLLPHQRSSSSPSQLEEERRLAFVGITRAMRHLHLTHARWRSVFGQLQPTIPSRFLSELPAAALQSQDLTRQWEEAHVASVGAAQVGSSDSAASDQEADIPNLRSGMMVRHDHFGLGRVLQVSGRGPSSRAQIMFQNVGLKSLVLAHAPLRPV